MAKKRKTTKKTTRKTYKKAPVNRKRVTSEGNRIIRDTHDDTTAAAQLGELYAQDIKDVGDTINLHESFDNFAKKHNIRKV